VSFRDGNAFKTEHHKKLQLLKAFLLVLCAWLAETLQLIITLTSSTHTPLPFFYTALPPFRAAPLVLVHHLFFFSLPYVFNNSNLDERTIA